MENILEKFFDDCVLMDKRAYKNLVIVPFIYNKEFKHDYISLDTAIDSSKLIIEEISSDGSVPELNVTNNCDFKVLILDGEELVGAKQNRVLNTTVLLNNNSVVRIPVSCVEQGRWEYKSKRFNKSNYMMHSKARMHKRKSVSMSANISEGKSFRSDQGKVWSEVHAFARQAKIDSSTLAMNDVYEGRKRDIEDYLNNIKIDGKINGLIAIINGDVVGIEYVSKPDEFTKILPKLVRSYAATAALAELKEASEDYVQKIRDFLTKISKTEYKRVPSVSLGEDISIDGAKITGSALVQDDEILHFMAYNEEAVEAL
jgi:hypothetical protein